MLKLPALIAIPLLLAASFASAEVSHDYYLTPNDKIVAKCQSDAGPATSKLKIKLERRGSHESVVDITAKICTTSFGFRRLDVNESIPSELLDENTLHAMKPGSVVNLPLNGRTVKLTRGSDSGGMMTFTITGLSGANVSSIQVNTPLKAGWQKGIPGAADMALPWYQISFQYRHPLAGAFQLRGTLRGIQRE